MNKNYFSKKYNVNNRFFQLEKTGLKFIFLFFFLIITNFASGQTTLFQFDFAGSLSPNINNTLAPTPAVGVPQTGNAQGYGLVSGYPTCNETVSSNALYGDSWSTNDFFAFTVNTTGFENLVFSYCNSSNSTEINNFDVKLTVGAGPLTSEKPAYIPTTDPNTITVNLPTTANNSTNVVIYIWKTNQPSGGNGNGANSSNSRTLYLDNVTLKGCRISEVAPTISANSPVCSGSTAVFTITGTPGSTVTYTGISSGTATILSNGTATVTVAGVTSNSTLNLTNVSNGTCTRVVSASATVTVNATAAPTVTTTAATCSAAGSMNVTNYTSGNTYAFTPPGPSVGAAGVITGGTVGASYTVKATNGSSCTSASSSSFTVISTTQLPTPAAPTVTTTAATCSAAGSMNVTNYASGNTYAFTPSGPTVSATGVITGGIVGTQYTVRATNGSGCISQISNSFTVINTPQLPTPVAPVVTTTAATCSAAGSMNVTNYASGDTYVFTPSGPTVSATGVITGGTVGASYTVKATNGSGCISLVSNSFTVINITQLPTPVAPVVTTTAATCSAAGSMNVTNYASGNTYVFTPSGPTVSATGVITGGTVGTSYTVRATNGSGCISPISNSFTVINTTQLPTPVAPVVTTTAATCSAAGSMNVTNYASGNTYVFTPSGPTVSGTGVITGGTVGASYTVKATNGSGCISPISNSFTVINTTQLPTPVAPEVTTTTATCSAAGTAKINNYIATNTYTFSPSGPIVETGGLVSGMTVGANYTVTSNNGSCTSVESASVNIKPLVTNTWTTSWSEGTPTLDQNILFSESYSSAANVDGCSCQVNSGKSVTIASGGTLKIINEVKVFGSLTFENNASLVQVNDNAANSGNIIYKRRSTPIRKSDYTYWSSPVSPQKLYDVSPNTASDKFYSFDATANNWKKESPLNNMLTGIGYIIRGPENNSTPPPPPGVLEAPFIGAPNNGVVSIIGIIKDKFYLLGNPYPSALEADDFLTHNSTVIGGTIYFWTHNTAIQLATNIPGTAGSGDLAYTSDDYASYNFTGGVGTGTKANSDLSNLTVNIPTGQIAAGQSFFTTSIGSGNAIFKNDMRVGVGDNTGNNSQFFKQVKNSKSAVIEKNRVWLNFSNAQGAFKQILVGYVTGATNEYDNAFDGDSFNGNSFIDFYSVIADKKLVIQGRSLPFDQADVIPLGYKTAIAGNFAITVDKTDGLFINQNVIVEDKVLNVTHDLKNGPYNFTTEKGTFDERFVLRFTNKTLATTEFDLNDESVIISKDKSELKIKSQTENINQITIFDLLGRKVFDKSGINANEFQTSNVKLSNQVVLVKVSLTNGKVITKKVLY